MSPRWLLLAAMLSLNSLAAAQGTRDSLVSSTMDSTAQTVWSKTYTNVYVRVPVTVPPDTGKPPAPGYPHQPAGYVRFAENNFTAVPAGRPASVAAPNLGSWQNVPGTDQAYFAGNYTVAPDPTAPQSPPGVFSTRFPKGLPGGIGPVTMLGWGSGTKTAIYLSLWIKVGASGSFESHPVGTKLGFLAYGEPVTKAQNEGFFFWVGSGSQTPMSASTIEFRQQNLASRNLLQNVSTSKMTAGAWHRWEAVLVLNTVGQANGVFQMWIDGQQTHNYKDVVYLDAANTLGFNLWKWNPTWGGNDGPVKQRDDYILLDHVYLSAP